MRHFRLWPKGDIRRWTRYSSHVSPKRDFVELARVLGISVAFALLTGFLLAVFVRPPLPFDVAFLGYTLMTGSLLIGFPLGENLDLERRRGTKRWDIIFALAVCTAALALIGYLVGLRTPPLVGRSENHLLFPAFAFIGLMAGALENQVRFKRK